MTNPSGVSTADVRTDRPARYGKQLVAHLSKHAEGEWDGQSGTGWVQFPGGRAELSAGDAVLHLRVEGADLARWEDVVGRHLVRFGTREELLAQWSRADGTQGTTQRNDGEDAAR
jgi:hypothetical protein